MFVIITNCGLEMEKTIELKFDGYWRDVNRGGVPNESGVYLVYVCSVNQEGKLSTVDKLVYIGEADEVRDRIGEDHEKRECWEGEVPDGKQLSFSFAPANKSDRERSEAALIFYHKPVCNDKGKDSFNYDKTTVKSSGRCEFIKSEITVERTE